jgi:hypothetical protein
LLHALSVGRYVTENARQKRTPTDCSDLSDIFSHRIPRFLSYAADNNLEKYIRNDNYELTQSAAIVDPSLTTWVYFDARNFNDQEAVIRVYEDGNTVFTEPLQNVYNADGTPLTLKESGSSYMTWDHNLGKMIVERTLEGEVNSDSPYTVFNYLVVALTDCVAKGATEFMFVMASHGMGYMGFGGDDNIRRRHLTQENAIVAGAIYAALNDVEGAPEQLDVLGFDACLMAAVGALDDFTPITKYYLASEAVEPGAGTSIVTAFYIRSSNIAFEWTLTLFFSLCVNFPRLGVRLSRHSGKRSGYGEELPY